MNHVWVQTVDGDLIRASAIRQINANGALRAILVGGSQFLLAEPADREQAPHLALELTAAIAAADECPGAFVIGVAHGSDEWAVTTQAVSAVAELGAAG